MGAVSAGVVTAAFAAVGGSSGDTIRATVQKTPKARPGTLRLSIPPGTLLRASSASQQDMVIAGIRGRQIDAQRFAPTSGIVIEGPEAETYICEAYCANFHKDNPTPGAAFSLDANRMFDNLLTEGKKRNLSQQALQAAVWMTSDNIAFADMNRRFPVNQADWNAAQALVRSVAR
ncbi:MAG TPA: hypothetical protein ENN80_10585 [Candidatus Hydrogenedentes bacterium]|nr:hypothetical protein [Candidatus Hydrogenedentota bacterium]